MQNGFLYLHQHFNCQAFIVLQSDCIFLNIKRICKQIRHVQLWLLLTDNTVNTDKVNNVVHLQVNKCILHVRLSQHCLPLPQSLNQLLSKSLKYY